MDIIVRNYMPCTPLEDSQRRRLLRINWKTVSLAICASAMLTGIGIAIGRAL